MAFPETLPSYTTANPNKTLVQDGHTARHNAEEADIIALATKVGIDESADTSSLDYIVSDHIANTSNPHSVTKAQVGLSNADNTSDATKLAAAVAACLSAVYPIGSLYFNATNGDNPATLLGFGTWAAYCVGQVPVGIDATQTEFDTVGETGGAKTHTLSATEMPSHTHVQNVTANNGSGPYPRADYAGDGAFSSYDQGVATQAAGGGGAHNNLQPYVVVYVWKRTA